jgi:hypothetical protein
LREMWRQWCWYLQCLSLNTLLFPEALMSHIIVSVRPVKAYGLCILVLFLQRIPTDLQVSAVFGPCRGDGCHPLTVQFHSLISLFYVELSAPAHPALRWILGPVGVREQVAN